MALEESGRTSATYYDDASRIPPLAMGSLHSRLAKANRRCIVVLSAFFVPNCTFTFPFWGVPRPYLGLEVLSRPAAAIQAQFHRAVIL
jgi:hypothetical protein